MDHVPLFVNPFLPLTRLCGMPTSGFKLIPRFWLSTREAAPWQLLTVSVARDRNRKQSSPRSALGGGAQLYSVLWAETMSGSKTLNSKIKKFWANWPSLSPSVGDSFMDGDTDDVGPLSLGTVGEQD